MRTFPSKTHSGNTAKTKRNRPTPHACHHDAPCQINGGISRTRSGLWRGVGLTRGRDVDARRGRRAGGRGPGAVLIAGDLLSVVRSVLPELLQGWCLSSQRWGQGWARGGRRSKILCDCVSICMRREQQPAQIGSLFAQEHDGNSNVAAHGATVSVCGQWACRWVTG